MSQGFTKGTPIDTDPTLSLNSDIVVPSQAAVVAYVASQIGTPVTAVNATSPILSSGGTTPNISMPAATGSINGYLTSSDWTNFNTAYTNRITSLTTTGSSGSATLISNVLNVPTYTLAGLGGQPQLNGTGFVKATGTTISYDNSTYTPTSRTLTINGTGYDLSADRSWTVTAGSADLPEISVSTSNAREDDYAPAGWPNSTNVVKVIRINSTNTNYMMSLGGLSNPAAGRIVTIYNSSTANNLIVIENLSTSSTAANRFRMTGNVAYFLLPNRSVTFIYDGTYWTQLSASNVGGLDFFDDATSGGSAVITTSFGGLMGSHASGTGAGSREGGPSTTDNFGEIALVTGSTAAGFSTLSALVRRAGSNGSFGGDTPTYSIPYLVVGKVAIGAAATVAQDYRMHFGMNGTSSLPTNAPGVGYLWVYQGTSSPSFWDVRTQNTGGTTSTVTTSLAITASAYVWLGVYKPGGSNIRDAVYFYSTNGVTYSVASKFVGVSGSYGGSPTIVVGSIAGTTSKDGFYDWIGSSFNLAR